MHLLLRDKASWVQLQIGPDDDCFDGYPELSIEDWHKKHRLWIDAPRRGSEDDPPAALRDFSRPRGNIDRSIIPDTEISPGTMWWRGKAASEPVAFLGRPHISLGIGGE